MFTLNKIDLNLIKKSNTKYKQTSKMKLIQLNGLVEGYVVKRPSKSIKSPYVADVLCIDGTEALAHTASLGCCGLAESGATLLMAPIISKSTKCNYRVYCSIFQEKEKGHETIIGIYPKLAEDLVEQAMNRNCLSSLQNVGAYKRETTIRVDGKVNSRFDFVGIDQNKVPFIMEVKNVPLADYEQRGKKCYDDREPNSKVAYFPDGYRKKSTDTVSPRAVKHLAELALIKKESITRCILCFVIQRSDVERFQASNVDPEYAEALKNAMSVGVEVIRMVVHWSRDGQATFVRDDLPLFIP